MSTELLEKTLRDLPRVGTLVENRFDRQVWSFSWLDKPYLLHFYPQRERSRLRRSPGISEFFFRQQLQKASIPVARGTALLKGFRIDSRLGDAVILEPLADAQPLAEYLDGFRLSGELIPDHRGLALQVRTIVHQIGRLKLGHRKLDLNAFVISHGKLYFEDAANCVTGGLKLAHVMRLAHSARPYATLTDLIRGWELLGPAAPLPKKNSASRKIWQTLARDAQRESDHVGRFTGDGWRGFYTKRAYRPVAWSSASRQQITESQWPAALPALLKHLEAGHGEILKHDSSGDVIANEIVLGGRPVQVIVKRPRRNKLMRYVTDIGRASRVRRTWIKAWKMLVRDVPVEFPLLMVEKRTLGYVVDQLIIFERVPGEVLARANLDAIEPDRRNGLFRRIGNILRRIENLGFTHFDAKSTNWIIFDAPGSCGANAGLTPIMVDLDGVRHYRWAMAGLERLLRAMKQHPQYTPDDSMQLCRGYAPRARLAREKLQEAAEEAQKQKADAAVES